jgi:hypothetical protein
VCIRFRGNVSAEPLPSNDKGDTHTHTEQRDLKPTLFFQNKESKLKMAGHSDRPGKTRTVLSPLEHYFRGFESHLVHRCVSSSVQYLFCPV